MSANTSQVTAQEIEAAYLKSGNKMGWRLLASPASNLGGAQVAFVGLNPGGSYEQEDQPTFAPKSGSAYVTECWGSAPAGGSRLQIQVRSLFERINVSPEKVLSGNLVPFRSPDWAALQNKSHAVEFGGSIWRRIIERARPGLVIAMAKKTGEVLAEVLDAHDPQKFQLGWGSVRGERLTFRGGDLIVLPHLSRFPVVTRAQSQEGLRALFGKWWCD